MNKKTLVNHKEARKLMDQYGSPLYVYRKSIIRDRYQSLKRAFIYPNTKIFYACKANTNIEILKVLKGLGAYIETVSPGEIKKALSAGFRKSQISYTCSNISEKELKWVIKQGIRTHLDSLNQIEWYGKYRPGSRISIRFNLDIGDGSHSHVITGGPESKFGVYYKELLKVKKLCQKYNLKVVGIHQHIGSNILKIPTFMKAMGYILNFTSGFSDLEFIDIGGGIGIPYKPSEKAIDIKTLGREISKRFEKFIKKYSRKLELSLEPGRYIVAEAGALVTTVTDIKITPTHKFIGVDTGFNHFLRPAFYDSYHHIFNLSNPKGKKEKVTVVGNICESGDKLAIKRELPKSKIGDILLFSDVGAYGYVLSSKYNSRPKPKEVII
jgi:diaminopimelate decarboxylase